MRIFRSSVPHSGGVCAACADGGSVRASRDVISERTDPPTARVPVLPSASPLTRDQLCLVLPDDDVPFFLPTPYQ